MPICKIYAHWRGYRKEWSQRKQLSLFASLNGKYYFYSLIYFYLKEDMIHTLLQFLFYLTKLVLFSSHYLINLKSSFLELHNIPSKWCSITCIITIPLLVKFLICNLGLINYSVINHDHVYALSNFLTMDFRIDKFLGRNN